MGVSERGIINKKIVNDENPVIQRVVYNMNLIELPFACPEFSVHTQNQRQTGSFVRTKFGFLHNVPFSFAGVLRFTVPR